MDRGELKTINTSKQPIDLLVSLAEKNEMDPWNIDIVKITDQFLNKVDKMDRKGLKVCGETLLYASILLRMKSEAVLKEDEEEKGVEAVNTDEWEPAPLNPFWNDPPDLEPPGRREAPRPATLPELIEELENAARKCRLREEREKKKGEKEKRSREKVKKLPFKEEIEDKIQQLSRKFRKTFKEKEGICFDELIDKSTRSGKISIFIPLLFMQARGLIELEQDTLFSDITIYPKNKLWTNSNEEKS